MTNFRRLPRALRVASLLRLLLPPGLLAASALTVTAGAWSSSPDAISAARFMVIALNLGVLGLGGFLVVHVYNSRVRQPTREPFLLETWQGQVKTLFALAAVPVCAITLAIAIPPTARAFQVVFPASIIGVFVCVAVAAVIGFGQRAEA